ncbi:uncharacterized protein GGS25DRAFT_509178 [Hypoxylon fragiforme]|uniref:uncharacterized protein n=1 Tax=Hypoxylon fragiforme TaxID=63214 RepID=UPI0020C65D00|nr:uncharacterized protein GGS25DRAFT_509178 [Hypoxylon fragiforme]KAI2602910.1 hypothetical protein GGS25DRAFT_509178 [Hypoxylon fragiforme]
MEEAQYSTPDLIVEDYPVQDYAVQDYAVQDYAVQDAPQDAVQDDTAVEDDALTVEDIDQRPYSSPYAGPHAVLYFKDGPPLSIPTALIDRHPRFSAHYESGYSLRLDHIPGDPGHVLVHYIFTGTYQCLQPRGASANEKRVAEFSTSVRVYTLAREYDLPLLEQLAKGEIERLGAALELTQLFDVLTEVHPKPRADDVWLHGYIKARVAPIIESPPASLRIDSSEGVGGSGKKLSAISFLLRAMVELCRERGGSGNGNGNGHGGGDKNENENENENDNDNENEKDGGSVITAAAKTEPERAGTQTPSPESESQGIAGIVKKAKKNAKERRRERRKEKRKLEENSEKPDGTTTTTTTTTTAATTPQAGLPTATIDAASATPLPIESQSVVAAAPSDEKTEPAPAPAPAPAAHHDEKQQKERFWSFNRSTNGSQHSSHHNGNHNGNNNNSSHHSGNGFKPSLFGSVNSRRSLFGSSTDSYAARSGTWS